MQLGDLVKNGESMRRLKIGDKEEGAETGSNCQYQGLTSQKIAGKRKKGEVLSEFWYASLLQGKGRRAGNMKKKEKFIIETS